MALAKDRSKQRGFAQARGGLPTEPFNTSSLGFLGFKGNHDTMLEDEGCSDPLASFGMMGHLPSLSDMSNSSSSNNNGVTYGAVSCSLREASPIVDFKTGSAHWAYSGSSVLSFEQGDRPLRGSYTSKVGTEEKLLASWIDSINCEYQLNHIGSKGSANSRLIQDVSCFEMASSYGLASTSTMIKDAQHGEEQLDLLYSDAAAVDSLQEDEGHDNSSQKRIYLDDGIQAHKKQCGSGKKSKAVAKTTTSKDPQSIAAKNRRERISERLKVLQELVPNGTKVDLITMLEKAITYVKFLQLQVKVLATDEFWPTQGGKAPELAQVKEAIDAILASNRDTS